jgi:hypothetical protein
MNGAAARPRREGGKAMATIRLTALALAAACLSATRPGFAQCATKEVRQTVSFASQASAGDACAEDAERVDKVCAPAGKPIKDFRYEVTEDKNLAGTTEVRQADGACVQVRTSGHAQDASRTPNGWFCSPASHTVAVTVSYCE